MTNTPMTSREAFERFDREHFGKKDMPINYETWECPMLGTRYVDAFVQSRYAYWQASQAQQEALIAELVEALEEAVSEFDKLPRSLGYDLTHKNKYQAILAKVKGQ